MNEEKNYKNPLSRSVVIGCIVFTAALALIMGLISYAIFNNGMMEQYTSHLTDVMNYTLSQIDAEDLKQCIETKEPTAEYERLLQTFDQIKLSYTLDYIVIVCPTKDGDEYDVMQVASGLSAEERAGAAQKDIAIPLLGDMLGAFYPPGFAEMIYNDMMTRTDIKFSESATEFGRSYDAATTIFDESGEPVALLTAGLSLDYIDTTMHRYIAVMLISAIILSAVFVVFMIVWLRKRVITPIKYIGSAAEDFEEKSRGQKDPKALILENKHIHTGDELESLADSLVAMSRHMRDYVEELIQSAVEMEDMKEEVTRVNYMAMRDALTGVKNKAAYDQQRERLDLDIKGGDARFGIVMIDLNNLKKINDTYGHDNGNVYLKRSCKLICDIFAHSPVFRVGGDEFVVVLVNRDYDAREALIRSMREEMETMSQQDDIPEWTRVSAAIGLSVYNSNTDHDSDTVLKRADEAMYADKKAMKAGRE